MESSGIRRIIFETSSMLNNNEFFVHCIDSDVEKMIEIVKNAYSNPEIRSPAVRAIRYVSIQEMEDGLDPNRSYKSSDLWDNPSLFPESTCALDALAKLLQELNFYVKSLGNTVEDSIITLIGNNFYDCMSGGCSPYYLAACRSIIERYNVGLSAEIYPHSETDEHTGEHTFKWHTVADFLEEIKEIPRFDHKLSENSPLLLSDSFGGV
jgi:hypothetical protein